ncbi:MAG TPA: Crp/Fnr family transcriptional regulator [Bdellovibrionota bacterium]|nr:Crp/Fnr family transcriptional regulator [Bdellovibrionota bacterium]
MFCNLPEEALVIIDQQKVINHFRRGQQIFYAGNFPSGLYCVNSGVVKLENTSTGGNTHILQVVQRGGILGYRSLFADEPYEATAIVHEDAEVCYIPKSALLELMAKYPDIGMKFLMSLSKDLRLSEDRMCSLTDRNAAERVAGAILFLKEHYRDQVWTRKEIAEWAGTTPETVMRSLAELVVAQIVELKGRKITILKKDILVERANLSY